jgi:hypothetical protein
MIMTDSDDSRSSTVRIGWGLGMLTLAVVVFCGVFLPGMAVWLLGGSAGSAGSAMVGGFMACWFAYLGILRLGVRRGWWV